jgi:hypothetical protein
MRIKKYFLILLIFASLFSAAVLPVFAQILPIDTSNAGKPLEVQYPEVPNPNAVTPNATTTLPRYVEYIFYFLIWGSGILAVLALIYGGYEYITALGNPDKLRDAKNRMLSAVLGLAIVLGSYLILWQINPLFLNFSLPKLAPFIDSISPGVYACKTMPQGPYDIIDAWVLEQIYKTERLLNTSDLVSTDGINSLTRLTTYFASRGLNLASISDENNIVLRKAIKEKMDELLKYINQNCYQVTISGDVSPEFNDKIESLWFVPEIAYGTYKGLSFLESSNPYGAAVFDNDDYTGIGNVFFAHMFSGLVKVPVVVYPTVKVSSIKPFLRYTQDKMNWTVRLYGQKEYNAGFLNPDPYQTISSVAPFGPYYADVSPDGLQFIPKSLLQTDAGIVIPPQSMRVDGEALVILYKGALSKDKDGNNIIKPTTTGSGDNAQTGYYFQIFDNSDNNLLDDYNIVYWDRCPGYNSSAEELKRCTLTISTITGGFGTVVARGTATAPDCCAKGGADSIMVLSNIKTF